MFKVTLHPYAIGFSEVHGISSSTVAWAIRVCRDHVFFFFGDFGRLVWSCFETAGSKAETWHLGTYSACGMQIEPSVDVEVFHV